MEINRPKFQGVLNILSFNRHFYIYGIIALALVIAIWQLLGFNTALLWWIIAGFVYGLLMPLLVSAYVYDFSGFYDFDWLKKMQLEDSPHYLSLNINAGFDETSYILKQVMPKSELQVFDFYDAHRHTEPAIVRARKVSQSYPNTKTIKTSHIPVADNSSDLVFLLSAAHEIRDNKERVLFLQECRRVCKENGKVIIVEHLRDWPNFLAFTIGFTHFFSSGVWRSSLEKAGFKNVTEAKFTPFMSIFTAE